MLIESYIAVIVLAYILLSVSVFIEKPATKATLQLLSLILLIAATYGSFDIEKQYCYTDVTLPSHYACITETFVDIPMAWLLGASTLFSAMLAIISFMLMLRDEGEKVNF